MVNESLSKFILPKYFDGKSERLKPKLNLIKYTHTPGDKNENERSVTVDSDFLFHNYTALKPMKENWNKKRRMTKW